MRDCTIIDATAPEEMEVKAASMTATTRIGLFRQYTLMAKPNNEAQITPFMIG
jgi:hypothetical protein